MSNEKREQQMMAAADRYADEVCGESCTGAQVAETINDFCAGWMAADKSRWISVKERLPKHDDEENGLITFPCVLACLHDGCVTEDYYDDINGEWGDYDGEVEYWMPMPPAPGKED